MKNVCTMVVALFAMVLASSCGPTLSTTKMTNKNLGNYETFAYLPNTNFEMPDQIDAQRSRVA